MHKLYVTELDKNSLFVSIWGETLTKMYFLAQLLFSLIWLFHFSIAYKAMPVTEE